MSVFIQDDDVIEVKVYCRKNGHKYIAYSEKEFNDLKLKDEDKPKYECLTVKMRVLTWALYNQLQDDAMAENSEHERFFNFKLFKENKLKKLIKEWDAKGKDGRPAPVNEMAIAHLIPVVAETILKVYDQMSYLTEEDEKN